MICFLIQLGSIILKFRRASHEALMLNYEEALTRKLLVPVPTDSAPSLPSSPRTRSRSAYLRRSSSSNNVNGVDTHEEEQGSVLHAWYNTSAHFIWVGDRTRQLDGAHIEYFRGIQNPIGIKVGPSMGADELVQLLNSMPCLCIITLSIKTHSQFTVVNPDQQNGKIVLITRYGASKVEQHLPAHIAAVRQVGHPVIWVCDPMHGKYVS